MNSFCNRVFRMLLAAGAAAALLSCEPELTDSRTFDLSYPGITDIAPSTNINVSPTWIGATPSDFKISRVRHEGESIETDCFLVDAATGVFSIQGSDGLATGLYAVSISCKSDGKSYNFSDIITMNMLKPVPEGIRLEPSVISANLGDVVDESSKVELPTAKIVTDGDHISIKKYSISAARRGGVAVTDFSKLFSVSKDGVVSILRNPDFVPGEYVLDFKLSTYVVNEFSEDGIFANALTVKVNSAPLALTYAPAAGKAEAGAAFSSPVPVLTGSSEELVYTIKAKTPADAPITIDASTGVISLPADHGLAIGTVCSVSVTATNNLGTADFDDVYSLEIVAFINPVTVLSYNDTTIVEGTKADIPVHQVDGDGVSFSFVELPSALQGQVSIDEISGKISLAKGNKAPAGTYTVKVKAENTKASVTASFSLTIEENVNLFTYVLWGNNLGLTPELNYANQFKIVDHTADSLKFPVKATDIRAGVTVSYQVNGGSKTNYVKIDPETGELTIYPTVFTAAAERRVHFCFVIVKTGAGTPAECQMKIPVFFNFHCAHDGIEVEFIPFAFQCNPAKGGVSAAPKVTGAEAATFTMDYRRSFNYYNLNGPASHIDGQPSVADGFLHTIWAVYYEAINKAINTGSRDPVSVYGRPGTETSRPCYFRESDHALLVNPEKWKDDAGYANGIFIGQVTFGTTGTDPQAAAAERRIFPLAVWFDTAFNNE